MNVGISTLDMTANLKALTRQAPANESFVYQDTVVANLREETLPEISELTPVEHQEYVSMALTLQFLKDKCGGIMPDEEVFMQKYLPSQMR